jgi:hypothetical protein
MLVAALVYGPLALIALLLAVGCYVLIFKIEGFDL